MFVTNTFLKLKIL